MPSPETESYEQALARTRIEQLRYTSNRCLEIATRLKRELELERGISKNLRELLAIRDEQIRQGHKPHAEQAATNSSRARCVN